MDTCIAITAMAGIFPGTEGAVSLNGYWQNVRRARPAKLHSLESKWKIPRESYFDPNPGVPYRTYMDSAYVISDDAGSNQIELGQRVLGDLLGSVKHTILPDAQRTGLCVATLWTDASYFTADANRMFGKFHTGTDASQDRHFGPGDQIAALTKAVNIEGPALAVDTACASSLYALDAAIGLIETGRADAVAVMGLNAFLPSFLYFGFSRLTALSPASQILPFSAQASGIIPAEAVAAILVEPLAQALAAGRAVLAVVRGLGLSADGGDRSVFAPSPSGQHLAYQRAYRTVDPASVDYVEAHGTATVLGDQTEIESLHKFFGPFRNSVPLPIGSAKALIGHTLAAAGVASLIKALCMIRDRVIPPHIPVHPHPRIHGTCLHLPTEAAPWPQAPDRCVAVSSFGFGGSNAHLVLGPAEPRDIENAKTGTRRFSPVAILSLEATIGKAHGTPQVAHMLSQDKAPVDKFPWHRFSGDSARAKPDTAPGNFFPDRLETEAHGLRMGPKPLSRLDPWQRLLLNAVQHTIQSAPARPEPEDTAVVVCGNLGGETGLQLSRHYLSHFTGGTCQNERYGRLEPGLEVIASGLPSLASGFPAFHFGLKGFHELLSGGSGSFWEALALAPWWLDGKCSTLILAGGRLIKSPLDLEGQRSPQAEGVAAFLLEAEDSDANAQQSPIAVIHAIVPCEPATVESLESACLRAGLPPPSLSTVEISQLEPDAAGAQTGQAQQVCGFLAEGTGVEAILKVLLTPGLGWKAIEIRAGSRPIGWVFLEKRREVTPRHFAPLRPLEVEFQTSLPSPVAPPAPANGSAAEYFLKWQQASQAAMISFLKAQSGLAKHLSPAAEAPIRPLQSLLRSDNNIVIRQPVRKPDGSASATLLVDESHTYFFDHDLDHVPGILMVEGVLQLVESLIPNRNFVCALELSFKRFCEKDAPVLLTARSGSEPEHSSYIVDISQDEAEVARCKLKACPVAARNPDTSVRPGASRRARTPDPRYLHKRHKENVLITELKEMTPGQLYGCELLAPPAGHILSQGSDNSYSLLYLLETTRQFVMLVAHMLEKIPLHMPMNLLRISLQLDQPVPRTEHLRFLCCRQPVQRLGNMTIADISLELHTASGRIGSSAIKAQVVDQEVYLKQRGLKPEIRGRT